MPRGGAGAGGLGMEAPAWQRDPPGRGDPALLPVAGRRGRAGGDPGALSAARGGAAGGLPVLAATGPPLLPAQARLRRVLERLQPGAAADGGRGRGSHRPGRAGVRLSGTGHGVEAGLDRPCPGPHLVLDLSRSRLGTGAARHQVPRCAGDQGGDGRMAFVKVAQQVYVPSLPTLWPHMLAGEGATPGWLPFSHARAHWFYFARNALWTAVRILGLEGSEVLLPAYHHGVEVEALVDAGMVPRFYRVGPRWEVDLEDLERRITPSTRVL